jgi:hypothetical protein
MQGGDVGEWDCECDQGKQEGGSMWRRDAFGGSSESRSGRRRINHVPEAYDHPCSLGCLIQVWYHRQTHGIDAISYQLCLNRHVHYQHHKYIPTRH